MRPNQFPSLDFSLGETADLLRDTVMSFAAEEIAPLAAEIDRSDRFPRALWPKMGALGLLGLTVEEDPGGAGMGYLEPCVAMGEILRRPASTGLSDVCRPKLCVTKDPTRGTDGAHGAPLQPMITRH